MLCYTSGTTGNPKGVLYEHRSSLIHAMTVISPACFDLSPSTVALPIVPMFHAAAWGMPFAAAMAGIKLVYLRRSTIRSLCRLMNEEKVTHSAGVPTVWLSMFQHIDDDRRRAGKLHDRHHRRLGGAADDGRAADEDGHPRRPCLGDDRDLADRHDRRAAGRIGTR